MGRIEELTRYARRRRLDRVLVAGQANVRALTGVNCDNAVLELTVAAAPRVTFYTDFRYRPMVRRIAPQLVCRDIARFRPQGMRIGYEPFIPHSRFLGWRKLAPRATFVDVADALSDLRAVKTSDEIDGIRAAEKLACEIWDEASAGFSAGMTERQMAAVIRKLMVDRGDGEAFSTIVCVGGNAAECHHEPDDTVWNGREPVLIDMGVKLRGVCSDLTRNLRPRRPSARYREVYGLVLAANRAAISAAKPGMSCAALDGIARSVIRAGGYGRWFGHSLGHGVGYEIHEAPRVGKRCEAVLKPGMCVTIEPGVYLEGELGVRIEDLILITETGCEVLSTSSK